MTGMCRVLAVLCLALLAGAARAQEGPAPRPGADAPKLDRGVLLIAGRNVLDPNFARTVVLITRYDEQGTTGVIINRPLQLPAVDALPSLDGLTPDPGRLHMGGPVATGALQLLIETDSSLDEAVHVFGDVHLVQEASALERLRSGAVIAKRLRLYAGYAGWAPGQLESELLRGDWFLWPADSATVFTDRPETLWNELMARAAARWALYPPLFPPVAGGQGRAYNQPLIAVYPATRAAGMPDSAACSIPEGT
jgi:putative transcriptional regulator